MTNQAVEAVSTETHPLLKGTRSTIGNWEMWKKRWDEAATLEERLGLLHVGLAMDWPDLAGRIIFYLDVANGHDSLMTGPFGVLNLHDGQDFHGGTFGRDVSFSGVLKSISRKALNELSKRYFVTNKEYWRTTFEQATWLTSGEVVDKLVWFVQPDKEGHVSNFRRESHAALVARKFFLEFSKMAFGDWRMHSYKDFGALPQISKLLIPKRAQLIPALAETGDIRWLLHPEIVHTLDAECRVALRQLALNIKGSFPGESERRAPTTINEAAYLGSPSAHVLILREFVIKEGERLQKRADLIRQREEAEKALQQI